ncbi:hypothetical protein N7492_007536 [Penicillium capsulatum]|uniref:Uncharacterized protein n=1 Tax=Penicillium capsulatum TaxID=69766 RepID=A0A9W9I1F7_9EURO|nr:hypothetical protein N7492_007536 [Penicillium capsulatum]
MHFPVDLCILSLGLAATVVAKDDPSYKPACANLQNTTQHVKWDSVLSVTERGSYNNGSNPVNLLLTLLPSSVNWSALPWEVPWRRNVFDYAEFQLPLKSAKPEWSNSTTVNDNFNMTLAKKDSTFELSGAVRDQKYGILFDSTSWIMDIHMPRCNTSDEKETGKWQVLLEAGTWSNTENWSGFRYPTMNATFDDRTVDMTINGLFTASTNLRHNDSEIMAQRSTVKDILGEITIRVHGVLDPYHSDVLDVNSSAPTWQRTVGFGNNSLNIGNDAKNGAGRVGDSRGSISLALFAVLVGMVVGV